MYAIIRAGGKQAKVQSGDVIEIERVKGDPDKLSFAPLLVVDDKGNAVSDRDVLAKALVTAKVLGESQGPKVDIFKYKNKTGYRRRQGHRQKYTQIEITEIKLPGATKATSAKTTEEKTAAKTTEEKPTAKSAAKTPAKSTAKTTEEKPKAKSAAKTPAKSTAKATETKKPVAKAKPDSSEEE